VRALLLLLTVLPFPWFGVRPAPPAGPTLFPERVRPGDRLEMVVDWPLVSAPGAADTLRMAEAGEVVEVVALRPGEVLTWIELAPGGWAPASVLDRPAEPIPGDLPPGGEGLVRGRVLPLDWRPRDLVALPDSVKYPGYEERALRLRAGAAAALLELFAAARADGIDLRAISGWRAGVVQQRLYARAVRRDPAQRWSASPGRSEHRLGTTVDVGPPDLTPLDPALEHHPAGAWLRERAAEFGWVISFSRERHEARGVIFEPWHLRWVGDAVGEDRNW
jgi:hypothetical protein